MPSQPPGPVVTRRGCQATLLSPCLLPALSLESIPQSPHSPAADKWMKPSQLQRKGWPGQDSGANLPTKLIRPTGRAQISQQPPRDCSPPPRVQSQSRNPKVTPTTLLICLGTDTVCSSLWPWATDLEERPGQGHGPALCSPPNPRNHWSDSQANTSALQEKAAGQQFHESVATTPQTKECKHR